MARATHRSSLPDLLAVWLALAALGQVAYLAYWPMALFSRAVPRPVAVGVALVRLGIYAGLAWGLARRERAAWAAVILELARTFMCAAYQAAVQDSATLGGVFPAVWAQGLLCGLLPLVVGLNAALAGGWRPGAEMEATVSALARGLPGLGAVAAVALRNEFAGFGMARREQWRVVLREGLPYAALLAAVEVTGFILAARLAAW